MEKEPINLLNALDNQREDTLTQKPAKARRPVFFWIFIFVSIIAALLLIRSILRSREMEYTTTLQPRKLSILETVRNFIFKPDNILIGQEEDRVNILLLGIGGPGHDGPYLSDTNIIASIKPSTNEVALISIPRDLGVKVGNHGWRKINSADAFGEADRPGNGGDFAKEVFEQTFNLKIPYYIRVDFTAFKELIDEVGGIEVNAPTAFTDTAYPGPNFSFQTVKFEAGPQILNGEKALMFARSRHGNNGEGSDFARSRRQQLVLEAFKEKMLSLGTYTNPARLKEMYDSVTNHVTTNLNYAELAYLASLSKDISGSKKLVLDSSPGGFLINTTGESGAFMLSPKTGNFDTINLAIQNVFEITPTATTIDPTPVTKPAATSSPENKSSLKLEIKNGTWIPGLAARTRTKLEEKGYGVLTVNNSLRRPIERSVIYRLSEKANSASTAELSKILNAASTNTLPEWLIEEYDNASTTENETGMKYNKDADILIILGTDTKE